MKKTLLFPALVIALAVSACNRQTRTATEGTTDYSATPTTTEPVTTMPPATTPTTTPTTTEQTATTPTTTETLGDRVGRATDRAGEEMSAAATRAGDAMTDAAQNVSARIREWRLDEDQIRADIEADRPIVRTKDTAGAPTGTVDTQTLQTAVEGRIQADNQLANLELDVNASRGGEVELEGKAQSVEQVSRAIALALDTEGVVKVTSKIKLDRDAQQNR